jgi:hypothetical protein
VSWIIILGKSAVGGVEQFFKVRADSRPLLRPIYVASSVSWIIILGKSAVGGIERFFKLERADARCYASFRSIQRELDHYFGVGRNERV